MRVEETKKQRINKIGAALKMTRYSWEPHWRELAEHFAPRRTRFTISDKDKGDKRYGKIINEHGMLAARTLRSGMFAGITSPARPWRRLTTPDPELAEFGRVKRWLEHINKNMRTLDRRSNLYSSLPKVFGDIGIFGTAAMAMMDDVEDGMRCYNFPIGSYWLAVNQREQVDTFWREYSMSVRNLVMEFGDPQASEASKWNNFTQATKDAFEQGNYERQVTVTHFLYPNFNYDPNRLESKFKKFASCYFESEGSVVNSSQGNFEAGRNELFLRESGMDRFRVLCPRWEITDGEAYGTACPGMDALGSTKETQLQEKRKSKAIEKQLNPPLKGPPSMRNTRASLIAGDLTLVDEREGRHGLSAIHETNVRVNDVIADIETKERRISRSFYEDLFLMLAQMEGIQPRNEAEIAERHEEKLLALGPVLESVNDDLLDPGTDIEFEIMVKIGFVPEPPPEVAGKPLKVEYESVLAKAQKLIGVAGTERFFSFAGNLLSAFPNVKDKINADEAIDEYADMMGVSAKILYTDEETGEIRQANAAALAKQQAAAAIPDLAKAAENLSGADLSTDNALSRVLAGA